jgi:hypothetical protein
MRCPHDPAERRQDPVMFSDFVGSTLLPAFATRRSRDDYEPAPTHRVALPSALQ